MKNTAFRNGIVVRERIRFACNALPVAKPCENPQDSGGPIARLCGREQRLHGLELRGQFGGLLQINFELFSDLGSFRVHASPR